MSASLLVAIELVSATKKLLADIGAKESAAKVLGFSSRTMGHETVLRDLEGQVGFEPTHFGLTDRCSETAELLTPGEG